MAPISLKNLEQRHLNGTLAVHGFDHEIADGWGLIPVASSGCAGTAALRVLASGAIAGLDASGRLRAGEQARPRLDAGRVHLFDAATGQRRQPKA